MKVTIPILALGLAWTLATVLAQENPAPSVRETSSQPPRGGRSPGLRGAPAEATPAPANPTPNPLPPPTNLPKFDLNYPGGTPRNLVAAIQKATGQPLNVIISDEDNNSTTLPSLTMRGINVEQLFRALGNASRKRVPRVTGVSTDSSGRRTPSYTYDTEGYLFETQGPPSADSVWVFQVSRVAAPPGLAEVDKEASICRFYQLAPYLEQGYNVDDITFAIRSGWKLLSPMTHAAEPALNYHKDTHLLIAAGDPAMLKLIDDALRQLERWRAKADSAPQTVKTPSKSEPAKK